MGDDRPEPRADLLAKIDATKQHPARVWNYWLGGKDNYPVDREAGEQFASLYPEIRKAARESRQFLIRAVRFLAGDMGVRQFLDIGTGLPTMQNTHEVAQSVAPESRIVYVDNDPLVLAHARALLTNTTPEGVTTYVDGDVREPDLILSDARNVLNFERPTAVLLLGILGHAAQTFEQARSIVNRLLDAVPSGSYLVILDGVEIGDDGLREATALHQYRLTTPDEFRSYFRDLDVVDPGLVRVNEWRPSEDIHIGTFEPTRGSFACVGRKP
ncbi:SAM-dependent methyltransferase [Pseudonocardia acaciae]|uniref:SAM-dependent methyltransferase n=1 Tax=Pseudonocardia acaciae TaxID=551276 RepID=UPI00048F58E9|nr:SAM-dependent methyltransferase [Pseudonocardia acaciae]